MKLTTQEVTRSAGALIVGLLAAALILSGSAAAVSAGSVTVDDPGNQTVEADVSFSASTTANMALSKDGTVVENVSVAGASGDTKTLSIDTTGVNEGDYNLTVTPTSENSADITVDETRMLSETPSVYVNATGENVTRTVTVDVSIDASQVTNATINLTNEDTNSQIKTAQQTLDPVDYADGSTVNATEIELSSVDGNVSATVTTDPAASHKAVYISADDASAFGAFGLQSNSQMIGAVILIGGVLLFFRERDYL